MQKKEWRRNLLVGLIVAVIFFGWWLRGFLYSNWRFHLFSPYSWSFIINEFESGWMLNTKSDWIFCLFCCFLCRFFFIYGIFAQKFVGAKL